MPVHLLDLRSALLTHPAFGVVLSRVPFFLSLKHDIKNKNSISNKFDAVFTFHINTSANGRCFNDCLALLDLSVCVTHAHFVVPCVWRLSPPMPVHLLDLRSALLTHPACGVVLSRVPFFILKNGISSPNFPIRFAKRMNKLQGTIRRKEKGGNFYYRLTIVPGIRKEFASSTFCDRSSYRFLA